MLSHILRTNTKQTISCIVKQTLTNFSCSGTPWRKCWKGRGQEDHGFVTSLGYTLCLDTWHNGFRILSIRPWVQIPSIYVRKDKERVCGEMAQGFKAAPDFAEDLGSWVRFPTPTLDRLQLLVIPIPEIWSSFLASMDVSSTQNRPGAHWTPISTNSITTHPNPTPSLMETPGTACSSSPQCSLSL